MAGQGIQQSTLDVTVQPPSTLGVEAVDAGRWEFDVRSTHFELPSGSRYPFAVGLERLARQVRRFAVVEPLAVQGHVNPAAGREVVAPRFDVITPPRLCQSR